VSLSAIPKALRRRVFQRDHGRCRYCGLVQVGQSAVFHINHLIPRSRGGPTDESNLALQCPWCSLHKADKILVKDPGGADRLPLFHPLTQDWGEHFVLTATGLLQGKTPTGSATISALRMNDPLPRVARSLQIRNGLLMPSSEG
jgi:hypothetical protein